MFVDPEEVTAFLGWCNQYFASHNRHSLFNKGLTCQPWSPETVFLTWSLKTSLCESRKTKKRTARAIWIMAVIPQNRIRSVDLRRFKNRKSSLKHYWYSNTQPQAQETFAVHKTAVLLPGRNSKGLALPTSNSLESLRTRQTCCHRACVLTWSVQAGFTEQTRPH